jgi:hypothetical protein
VEGAFSATKGRLSNPQGSVQHGNGGIKSSAFISKLRAIPTRERLTLEPFHPQLNNPPKAEEYFSSVTALQHNKTLKTLSSYTPHESTQFTTDESKHMAKLLKKLLWKVFQLLITWKGYGLATEQSRTSVFTEDGTPSRKVLEVLGAVRMISIACSCTCWRIRRAQKRRR